ncbi:non-ribosomal peptide synthetase [Ktedonobacteria bacterium brp13]|nr:non-ribosomal peptide synthetase [Ktedonobacteria bacterium brp13]
MQQARLWMQQGENQVWYTQCSIRLSGQLDMPAILGALQELVQRHDILRTAFRRIPGMEVPVQVVSSYLEVRCSLVDVEYLAVSEHRNYIDESLVRLQGTIANLETPSLFAVELLRFSPRKHLLLICLPALCADEYTLMRMILELSHLYSSSLDENEQDEEPLQYAEVSAWQEELQQSEAVEALREYWRQIDLIQHAAIRLPFVQQAALTGSDTNVVREDVFALRTYEMMLEKSIVVQLSQRAQHFGVSMESWLLACWGVVLWRLNGMQDSLIGVSCNGRTYEELTEELSKALGLYTRAVPFELRLGGDLSFEQVVRSVNKTLLEKIKRQVYFSWKDGCNHEAGVDEAQFFPIGFEYALWPVSFVSENIEFSLHTSSSRVEKFLLKLGIVQVGEQVQLCFQYNPKSINALQVEQLASAFQTLLYSAMLQPQTQVSTLALLEPAVQSSLLTMGSALTQSIPLRQLHQLFEAQVQRRPSQVAVIGAQEQLTYQQLNERANQLAHVLRQRGVGPNMLVGLCLPRQAHMLVGVLGILKAGGAYLPLDAGSPVTRLTYQLQESGVTLLLTQSSVCPSLPEWTGSILCLEDLADELAQSSIENCTLAGVGDDLMYVIYTSGSTGLPKGVMVRQSSVVNYTQALCEKLGSEPGWQYATVSTLAADLGNTAIFCALASGGCVQVLDYETVTSGEAMANWVEQHPIDVLKIVPSHLSALLESERAQELLPRRALVLGGESLPVQLVERVQRMAATCHIYNHYGPTESTIGVLVNPLDAQSLVAEGSSIALGNPITNTQMYVLDRHMQLLPAGVVGELYIGGAGLALGYLQQAEQTAEHFVPHPYSQRIGERLYRTGDLVYYGADGKLNFVGRSDGQVKLRGYRIEVGEIETVLRQHPLIWDCAVMLQEEGPGAPRLIGYIVARTSAGLVSQDLHEALREKIPEYMIPSSFVMLESLPLTANGKLDRRQLPLPELSQESDPVEQGEPHSPTEEMLVQMWKELLQVPAIGVNDNFFALGGHSLLATRVMARLQAMFQIVLPVQMLFEAPTVAGLAQRIEQVLRKNEGIEIPALVGGARPEELPLSFAQQRLWFLDQLNPGSIAYLAPRALRLSGELNTEALERSLEKLIERHESLRTTFEERSGRPIQVIHPICHFTLPLIDLSGLLVAQREMVTQGLVSQDAQNPCDLAKGPMLRASLLRVDAQEHVMLLTLHHIVTDKWSIQILVRELTTLYQAYVAGKSALADALPIQYADYALWQRQWLQGEVLETLIQYWQENLRAPLPVLNLPTDYPRAPLQSSEGATSFFKLSAPLTASINALGQKEGATLFMILLSAFTVLLHYYTGQDDLVVGTDIANRNQVETEGLIGFFVNQLVLRVDLVDNPSFLEIVRRVRQVALKAYTHQDLPFDRLVDALNPERDLSRTPLFQAKFVLQNVPKQAFSLSDMKMELVEFERGSSKFDLLLDMTESGHELLGWLEYRTDLFKAETIALFLQHFETIIHQVVDLPERRLDELENTLAEADGDARNIREQELRQVGLQKLKQMRRKITQDVNQV